MTADYLRAHGVQREMIGEASSVACQACGEPGLRAFYAATAVPVHSCVLLGSRDEAVRFPRGDVVLAACPRCGFIQNIRFDPDLVDYTRDYEETQGFSPKFNAFLQRIVEDLIARYGVRNKEVLEIGCGEGAFLQMICELGRNRGVGIDPAYDPARAARGTSAERVRFIPEFFGEEWEHLTADLVVCRHTLEHLAPVRGFLELVRRSMARTDDAVLFLEVPDTGRVLREGAFWDVYYEHCSYFTPPALERLLRLAGFDPLRIRTDYDDQYLLAEATPTTAAPELARADMPGFLAATEAFAAQVAARVTAWDERAREWQGRRQRVVVWGAGSKAVAFLTTTRIGEVTEYAVDINPHKRGTFLPGAGQKVVAPDFLPEYRPDVVIAMNPIYAVEIGAMLRGMGIGAKLMTL